MEAMNDRNIVKTSKFLSLVLRHKPEAIGIALDENGWVDVQTLLTAMNQHGRPVGLNLLQRVVKENAKQRFAFSDDGSKIRANQGHSVAVNLQLTPKEPPDTLYHGTVEKFIDSIQEQGLLPGSRQHVHLSTDIPTATSVGMRRGKPILLVVRAKRMYESAFEFYLSKNGVWLTAQVPPEFIGFDEVT